MQAPPRVGAVLQHCRGTLVVAPPGDHPAHVQQLGHPLLAQPSPVASLDFNASTLDVAAGDVLLQEGDVFGTPVNTVYAYDPGTNTWTTC